MIIKRRGTIGSDIINNIRKLTKEEHDSIRKEIRKLEPELYEWVRNSVKENISDIRFHGGVQILSEEGVKNMATIIAQAKIEGYLIALYGQDRVYNSRFFLEDDDSNDIPYSIPINAILEGDMTAEFYEDIKKSMTKKDKADPNHWKSKALKNFERNNYTNSNSGDIAKYFKETKDKGNEKSPGSTSPLPGDVAIEP